MSEREQELEKVILNVETGYSENWNWLEDNFDVLKTIPNYVNRIPNYILAKNGLLEIIDERYIVTEMGKEYNVKL